MSLVNLLSELAAGARWRRVVHQEPTLLVVEVAEGLRNDRTQFVELAAMPHGSVQISRGGGATRLTLPHLLQIRSRVAQCSGGFYDPEDPEVIKTIDVILNDFQLFGSVRIHPFYYATLTIPASSASVEDIETLALATAYIADQIELNLGPAQDQF